MALLNFPTNPNVDDTYTIGQNTWIWTGTAWIKLTSSPQSPITINTNTNSTSTYTGSVTIEGGLGIGGSVNIGSTSTIAGAEIITTATIGQYGVTGLYAGTDTAVSANIGNVTVWNTSTFQTVTDRGNSTTNQVSILNPTNATSTTTGALVITGGAAIGGDLWLGGTLYSSGVPVITTSSLIESVTAGPDIAITATTGYITGTVALIISNTSTLQTVTTRGNTTDRTVHFSNTTNSTSSSTGAVTISGGLGVAGRVNSESIQIADAIMDSGKLLVNSTATVVVDEYSGDDYRSSKYLIQIQEGTGASAAFETIEILLMVDNQQTVYATEYAVLTSNGDLGEFAADVQGDNTVRLYFTPYYSTQMTLQIFRTTIKV
jgi:hypothetical protein